jgi:hypothetical protein
MLRIVVSAVLLCAATILPVSGQEFRPGPPLDCDFNNDCFIQQYVDTDPGPGAADFMCGPLTYDGHKGTDFRLRDRQMMRDGVPVIASESGTVLGVRDGMQDVDVSTIGGRAALNGKDCGNGVRIDHGGGWTAQYCHLRRGSVQVRKGQRVQRGQRLGLVGMSGAAQFPHVHITVRKDGEVVDPYRGVEPPLACGGRYRSIWSPDIASRIAYRAGGILTIGMHGNPKVSYEDIKEGRGNPGQVAAGAPALIAWGHVFGIRQGDVLRTRITGPDGGLFFFGEAKPHRKNQAQAYKWSGKRNRGSLPSGTYTALIELVRDGAVYDAWQTTTAVR